jgi:hypothetical protein
MTGEERVIRRNQKKLRAFARRSLMVGKDNIKSVTTWYGPNEAGLVVRFDYSDQSPSLRSR